MPFDALATDRLGSREGPRAIRVASRPLGPELDTGIDPGERMRLLDYGDAPVAPFDVAGTRAAIEATVGEVVAAGAVPIVLGDTDNHGTMMRAVVKEGHVDPRRYVQIGLRGGWPGPEVFAWQAEVGISHFTAEVIRREGIDEVVRRAIEIVGAGPAYLSVDIDVLDPAFAGRTGTPEAGGLLPRELIAATRQLGEALELCGADVVETVPGAWGTEDVAAMTASATVGAILTGIAARAPRPS